MCRGIREANKATCNLACNLWKRIESISRHFDLNRPRNRKKSNTFRVIFDGFFKQMLPRRNLISLKASKRFCMCV